MNISDINSKISTLTKSNTTSFPAADRLIAINNAYERVISLILQCDGRWQWDDSNFTTFPIATTTLVSGQRDYTFDVTMLRVLKVEVLGKNGKYYTLNPIDFDDMARSGTVTEYMNISGGPLQYDVQGGSIVLYPAPDNGVSVTLAAGLKVYYQRTADLFTSAQVTAGTKVPGFNSLYHDLIPYWVAYEYAIVNLPTLANGYLGVIQRQEAALKLDYSKRDKDDRQIMKPKAVLYI